MLFFIIFLLIVNQNYQVYSAVATIEHTCDFLTAKNFSQELNSSEFYFIFFFDPPCSHSIKYIPFWNQMVLRYRNSKKLKIACVNCLRERNMCDDLHIYGFPTINWYKRGVFIDEYPNQRNLDQLFDFADSWQSEDKMPGWLERQQVLDAIEFEKEERRKERKRLKAIQNNVINDL